MSMSDDHDQRFKALLKEFLPEFMALFFPAWSDRFDFPRTEWLEQDAFLDPPDGDRRLLDLVAKVPTRVPTGDRPGECLLLIHIEVESAEAFSRLRTRMLQYYAYLRRTHDLPVLPVGLFLYVGRGGVGREVYEESLWDCTLLRFEFFTIGLPGLDGTKYQNAPSLLGVALSALMKLPAADRALLLAQGLERIAQSGENELRKYLLAECYENYFPLPPGDRQEFERLLAERLPEGRTVMNGLELRELRGERRAQQAQRDLIAKQITKKFGPLPESVTAKLSAVSIVRLEEIALALIDAKSLAELGLVDAPA